MSAQTTPVERALDQFRMRDIQRRDAWTREEYERALVAYREVLSSLAIAACRVDDHPARTGYRRDLSREAYRAVNFLDEVTR